MNKNAVSAVILLTIVWIILREDLSVLTAATGLALSAGCVFFCRRFIPAPRSEGIGVIRFGIYILYLIGQVYKAGIMCIGIVFKGAQVSIVEVKTPLKNQFLRTVLANSITLVPGSVTLDLKDDKLTILWLNKKEASAEEFQTAAETGKNKLERLLMKTTLRP